MSNLTELHKNGISLLKDFDKPALEAKIILLKASGVSEEKFYSEPELSISDKKRDEYLGMLEMRKRGMPLAYIIGTKEFWSLDFKVGRGVLIPRPETEGLVKKILDLYYGNEELIIDMGTGCGNIALSAAKELPETRVVGLDISEKAVSYAKKNSRYHHLDNVRFIQGDMFGPLSRSVLKKKCGIIVCNPPYVAEKEWLTLDPQIRKIEPKQALVSSQDGYEFINQLIYQAPEYLRPGGYLIFEIGKGQEDKVRSFFSEEWDRVECERDLAGIPRIFFAQRAYSLPF
jgi:release factor glutamine methyltransferase